MHELKNPSNLFHQTNTVSLQPRLIRFRDAPRYLGMDRNRFNKDVRPHITIIPIGSQGIAFDRVDLDAWVEQYKHRSGRPAVVNTKRKRLWDAKQRQGSTKGARTGISISKSSDIDFEKALALVQSKRQNAI